jgi:hypothetical protein
MKDIYTPQSIGFLIQSLQILGTIFRQNPVDMLAKIILKKVEERLFL